MANWYSSLVFCLSLVVYSSGQAQPQPQQPVHVQQPMQGQQQPVHVQQPMQGQQPIHVQQPMQGQQQPIHVQQPMQGQQPVHVQQPMQGQQPIHVQQPVHQQQVPQMHQQAHPPMQPPMHVQQPQVPVHPPVHQTGSGAASERPWYESLPAVAMDYKVHVDAGKEDCYFQYVQPGAAFYVSFQVSGGQRVED